MTIRQRIFQRYLPVVLALAGMGYLLAEAAVFLQRIYGGIPDSSNRIMWRTPLTMAAYGLIMMLSIEALTYALRRKRPILQPPVGNETVKVSQPGPSA